MALAPDALLAGPRGRRLCLSLAGAEHGDEQVRLALRSAIMSAAYDLDPGKGTSRVMLTMTAGGPADLAGSSPADVARQIDELPPPDLDDRTLLAALAHAVDFARYWQEPDGEDVLASTPQVRAALSRIARQVADAAPAAWWTTPVDLAAQWSVTFGDGPSAGSIAGRLARWHDAAVREEAVARRERPADPRAMWSGSWWSIPPVRLLPRSTRQLEGLGPAGLWLVEDAGDWDHATAVPVTPPTDAAVYEVDGPEAWAELCARYPLEVTASRRHDWYRVTGRDGRWVIPDWARAAEDLDGVHLTVAGYLTTAGRAIAVGEGLSSVLAGWDPDQTYWFTDVASDNSSSQDWVRRDDGRWARSQPPG
ncbi:hypothetical protein ATJ97_1957 [Georgenia soli]|uniref:Uncharacterized protein n=1 Tax=Georgenia soli TaxID=638953 RepID=A0A2A9ELQ1_9MICO|nr:hypothetical protein [Georgenia soli]PFG39451.1 hypothetical protein ATJ97_1957 [Georgenia soli]